MNAADCQCSRCQWWRPLETAGSRIGLCVRTSPRPGTTDPRAVWPNTNADDFCGDFEADEEQG